MTPAQFTSSSLQIRLLTELRRLVNSSSIIFLFLASLPRNFISGIATGLKAMESPTNATTIPIPAANNGNQRGEVARTTPTTDAFELFVPPTSVSADNSVSSIPTYIQSFSISERAAETFS